jgi:hypothetical protein
MSRAPGGRGFAAGYVEHEPATVVFRPVALFQWLPGVAFVGDFGKPETLRVAGEAVPNNGRTMATSEGEKPWLDNQSTKSVSLVWKGILLTKQLDP